MSLAIECGATNSTAIYLHDDGTKITFELGSANFKLMSTEELKNILANLKLKLDGMSPQSIGIGMPGLCTEEDKENVASIIKENWPMATKVWTGSDLETALASLKAPENCCKIVIIAGTGSCCYGTFENLSRKVGGFGHILGDRGSSYYIAYTGLRLALENHEYKHADIEKCDDQCLLKTILIELQLKSLENLTNWVHSSSKSQLSSIAPLILKRWSQQDPIALKVVNSATTSIAKDCCALLNQLKLTFKESSEFNDTIYIGLTGSLFTKNEQFTSEVITKIKGSFQPKLSISFTLLEETVYGALNMVNQCGTTCERKSNDSFETEDTLREKILPILTGLPETEMRNEKSMNLHTMGTPAAFDLMMNEESSVYSEIRKQKDAICTLVEKVAAAFKQGGRLFYVGSGTSGRLGILDASECPPTFKSPPEWVQGIIAGGFSSVAKAKEGAEDSILDGMRAIEEKNVTTKDIVVGIASSGRTPFVWGAIHKGKQLGAFTTLLTFNKNMKFRIHPDLLLCMSIGPEILTGSTRLKCGSATKCILNTVSTLAMVKYGKCYENLMIDLNPANEKLRQRALRIVKCIFEKENIEEEVVKRILIENKHDIRKTIEDLNKKLLVEKR